jgi:hypothetical protein
VSARRIIGGALCALALVTAFDHGMRKMQVADCQDFSVECPDKLWWFASAAETDGELEALTGVHPLDNVTTTYPDEFRLVGWGCEGAGDKPLFRNEEDEFPQCEVITTY